MNPLKAERAKPSLSSDYNLLFKNKIGESSLDIHRNGLNFSKYINTEEKVNELLNRMLPGTPALPTRYSE